MHKEVRSIRYVAHLLMFVAGCCAMPGCDTILESGGQVNCPDIEPVNIIYAKVNGEVTRIQSVDWGVDLSRWPAMNQVTFSKLPNGQILGTYRNRSIVINSKYSKVLIHSEPDISYRYNPGLDVYMDAGYTYGYIIFSDTLTPRGIRHTNVNATSFSSDGDTSSSEIFRLSARQRGSSQLEQSSIIRLIPTDGSSFYYVKDREIESVYIDSTGDDVYINRFYFERSLWEFVPADSSHNRIRTLPKPENDYDMGYSNSSSDGRYFYYRDEEKVHIVDLVDVELYEVKKVDPYFYFSRAFISSAQRLFFMADISGCMDTYSIYDLDSDNARETAIPPAHCAETIPSLNPAGDMIYHTGFDGDTLGVWKTPVADLARAADTAARRQVFLLNDAFDIPNEYDHSISISHPIFLNDNAFILILGYHGPTENQCR